MFDCVMSRLELFRSFRDGVVHYLSHFIRARLADRGQELVWAIVGNNRMSLGCRTCTHTTGLLSCGQNVTFTPALQPHWCLAQPCRTHPSRKLTHHIVKLLCDSHGATGPDLTFLIPSGYRSQLSIWYKPAAHWPISCSLHPSVWIPISLVWIEGDEPGATTYGPMTRRK